MENYIKSIHEKECCQKSKLSNKNFSYSDSHSEIGIDSNKTTKEIEDSLNDTIDFEEHSIPLFIAVNSRGNYYFPKIEYIEKHSISHISLSLDKTNNSQFSFSFNEKENREVQNSKEKKEKADPTTPAKNNIYSNIIEEKKIKNERINTKIKFLKRVTCLNCKLIKKQKLSYFGIIKEAQPL